MRASSSLLHSLIALSIASCEAPQPEGQPCETGDCAKLLVCDEGTCRSCEDSSQCKAVGECAISADRCVATEAGCRASKACEKESRCTLKGDACERRVEDHVEEKARRGPRDGSEGCPCGCDRSEEMLGQLEAGEEPASLQAARESLRVIAEREDAGYITDAMVSHRLGLRAFERGRSPNTPLRISRSEGAQALRDGRAALPTRALGGLRVRSEFVVFGRTVETVNGREKELAPCFRLWLELENIGEAITLDLPGLEGSVPFDTRRWYLEGSDGEPWDGILEAGETRSVLLIGYVDSPLEPEALVDARFEVNGGSLGGTTRALGRWNARL